MKKIVILIVSLVICLSAVACGSGKDDGQSNVPGNTSENQNVAAGESFDQKFVSGQVFEGWSFYADPKNDIFAWINSKTGGKFIAMSFVWENTVSVEKYVDDFIKGNPT